MKLFLCRNSSNHHTTKNTTSTSPPHVFQNISDESIDSAESIIRKWGFCAHSDRFSTLFSGDRKEAKLFLEGVTTLQKAMHYYLGLSSSSEKLVRANHLMSMAMKRLEKEFYVILSSNQVCYDSESSVGSNSSNSARSSVEDGVISEDESPEDLRSIAECMIASGHGKECVDIYKLVRKSAIDEALYNLGVETLSISMMQKMEWKVLESKIKRWLRAVRVAMKTVFQNERTLCIAVFSDDEDIAETCFAEICRDSAADLFSFAENFGRSKRILSPEKIFRALDMYEAVSELLPEIESVFSHKTLSRVRAEAALVKLGEAVRAMVTQFEAAIKKDPSKPPAGGGVHPLARYVMNFLAFLADYSGAMSDIIVARTPLPESYLSSPAGGEDPEAAAASFTDRVAWLILVLLCRLDAKAAQCNDVALSYLFLANNLNYVVSKVRNSNLGILIGVDWVSKQGSKVNQYLATYEQMGWSDVISSLPSNPTAEICHERVKECFRQFNTGFHDAFKRQASWVIHDPKLRDEVKSSIAEKLVPGYMVLYDKHRGKMGDDAIIKYAPEDLNKYLSDLFADPDGLGGSISSAYSLTENMTIIANRQCL